LYIYYSRNIYEKEPPKYSLWHILPIFVLGFASSLIVEHITLYSIVLAIFVLVYAIIKFKKVYVQFVSYLAGTVIGTALMFSNSVYHNVVIGNDGYRTIGDNGVISTIKKAFSAYFCTISPEGFFKSFVLNVIIATVCVILWHCLKGKLSLKAKIIGELSLTVIVMYAGFSLMFGVGRLSFDERYTHLQGFPTAVYILAMFVFLAVLPLTGDKKTRILFMYFSIGCMIAPLFVVTPIGSRCFFASYVMMIILAIELFSNVDDDVKQSMAKYSKTAMLVTLVGLLYLLYVYSSIYVANVHRVEKAQKDSQTKTVIKVKKLPYEDYVWLSELPNDEWKNRFKAFNGIDENVKIKEVERNN
jgi:hypothetical protein